MNADTINADRASLAGYDLFLRHTDKNGKAHVAVHRVWDGVLFVTSQQSAAAKEGGAARCEQITEAEYREERV